ncbi:MAG: hypothetical protein H7833_17515 [Magnetococcus sp. DMHC-1]
MSARFMDMTGVIRKHDEYVSELILHYEKKGYRILDIDDFSQKLGYFPDFVAEKDGDITIVEVKSKEKPHDARISNMREIAEKCGYKFELKLIPKTPREEPFKDAIDNIHVTIKNAENLIKTGHIDNSIFMSWLAIEVCVRNFTRKSDEAVKPVPPGDIVRNAREFDLVNDDEIVFLRKMLYIRDRFVHGFVVDVEKNIAVNALKIAKKILKKILKQGKMDPVLSV